MMLITGFEPFDRFEVNSSWESVRLVEERLAGLVVARRLPVDHHLARQGLLEALEEFRPAACLCTGLVPAETFRIETRARRPPEFAALPGQDEYEGVWRWQEIHEVLSEAGMPVCFSSDAGQYVCESTYWSLLEFRHRKGFPAEAAFLHVPPLSERFPVDAIADAVEAVVRSRIASREGNDF